MAIFQLAKLYEENFEFQSAYNLAEYHRQKDKFVGFILCSDFLRRGIGCQKNEELADQYEKEASDQRFVNEQVKFAMLFHHGKGIKPDSEKFLKWLEIAAKNNSPIAQANLCRYHMIDDQEMAKNWGEKSASAGCNHGIWNLAHFYNKNKDYDNEDKILQKLADLGYRRALVKLGKNLKRKKKFPEAFQKFKEAADRNSVSGICHCGIEMFNGKLTDKNVDEGLRLMNDAANCGCRKALKKLIDIYKNGLEGVEKNQEIVQKYEDRLSKTVKRTRHSESLKK